VHQQRELHRCRVRAALPAHRQDAGLQLRTWLAQCALTPGKMSRSHALRLGVRVNDYCTAFRSLAASMHSAVELATVAVRSCVSQHPACACEVCLAPCFLKSADPHKTRRFALYLNSNRK